MADTVIPLRHKHAQEINDLVAMGSIPGATVMSAIGERESMGTTATGEDIWRGNELSPAPTSTTSIPTPDSAGESWTIVSEDVQDTTLGTGVRRVQIDYLDVNGGEQSKLVDMDGTNPVATGITDGIFANDLYSTITGSNGAAEGHIKIYKTGSVGLVYNMIAAGGNKALVPNRMIPAGKSLLLQHWHGEEAQGKRVNLRIRSTDMNGVLIQDVFCFKDVAYLKASVSGSLPLEIRIPSLSIVKVSGWAVVSGAETSCGWKGLLVTNV